MHKIPWKKLMPLMALAGLAAIAYTLGLQEVVSLENLQARKEEIRVYTEERLALSAALFFAVYAGIAALSLPVASVMSLLGGFLFGKWLGTLLAVTGATVGASVVFLVARSAAGQALREKAGKFYSRVEGEMRENAVPFLLFLRLVPLIPFWLVNIVPALFNIRLKVFVATTFFGIIPGSFVYVNAGEAFGGIESMGDILSPDLLLALGLLGLVALLPVLYRKWRGRSLG